MEELLMIARENNELLKQILSCLNTNNSNDDAKNLIINLIANALVNKCNIK